MLQRLHDAQKEGAVSHRNKEVLRDTAQLLVHLVKVGFSPLIKEGVVDMAGIIRARFPHHLPADIGTTVPRAGNDLYLCAVGGDHGDFPWGGPLRDEYPALNPGSGAVGGDAVSGVAAAVLDHLLHPDGLTVGDKYGSAPVLEGEGGHIIVHFQQDIPVQADDRGHPLPHSNSPPLL